MNKAELIASISEEAGISKAQANSAIDAFTGAIQKNLKKGNKVTLVGFGTFSLSKLKARKGRNPKTGEPIKIAAKKVARFKPGKGLAETLNPSKEKAAAKAPAKAPAKATKTAAKAKKAK